MRLIKLLAFTTALLVSSGAIKSGNDAATYIYGVDFETLLSNQEAQCLRNSNYQSAFVMGYSPDNNGTVRYFATASVTAASKGLLLSPIKFQKLLPSKLSANITAELYMVPQPKSFKSGEQQFSEFYYVLSHCTPIQKTMWLKSYGVSVGIYTNLNDWNQITNGYSGFKNGIRLWYGIIVEELRMY
ncbi:hypothetical protein ANCCEY_03384 [Ancylostoma ceylanicum]|uniref:Uncharacterized protein n=1 Tax=Ancylostoma ceylanicum TaxID=53326 RepID=A0A0D6MBA0_9BILA|nr:hypothetical protein ANCCEY_03384 [Ancylostoma ceylanicum]